MDLFVRKIIKVPLYQLTCFLLVAIILVNEINCSDNYVSRTPPSSATAQTGSTPLPRQPQPQSAQQLHQQHQQQYQGSPGGMQSSGGGLPVENVHKMLSHAMTETINNEFGSEY